MNSIAGMAGPMAFERDERVIQIIDHAESSVWSRDGSRVLPRVEVGIIWSALNKIYELASAGIAKQKKPYLVLEDKGSPNTGESSKSHCSN